MAMRKKSEDAPQERLEADRRRLELLAAQCGEEAGLHRPLNDVTGGVITGIPEDTDLAQALSDRETTDLLVHLLRDGAYGICEGCGRRIPEARLRFQPASTRCVECQAHWDRLNGRTA